tara:strand:- start:3576 stop:4304 length:729 start_codon:yes stop_codon:yes gene_type:complete
MIKYSLVIPFYNEEKNINKVIKILKKISKKINSIEFILINNGSTDNSDKEFIKNLKNQNKKIFRLFEVKKNIGYGYGIKFGLNKCKGNYLAWTHSDLQTNPMDIIKAIKIIKKAKIEKNIFIKGLRKKRNKKENFQTKAMEIISSLVLGIKIRDINAQPKLISKLFYQKYLKKFAPNDLSFDLFSYSLAVYKKVKTYEVAVLFKKRKHGEVKGGGEGGSIFSKIKLILVTLRCLIYLKLINI